MCRRRRTEAPAKVVDSAEVEEKVGLVLGFAFGVVAAAT
jgi:hypothetical protein